MVRAFARQDFPPSPHAGLRPVPTVAASPGPYRTVPGESPARTEREEAIVSELVLVATDGGRTGASALRFAVAYAEARDVTIEIISVVEPLSDLPTPLPHRDELEHAQALGVAERVREHLRDVVGPQDWSFHIRLGRAAPAICETARARRARLLVLGVEGRNEEVNATAVEVLHLTETPVLVVRDAHLPRVAVVGIDFRPSSFRAAREALRLVGADGVLHLVHVEPFLDFPAASVWDWSGSYHCAVAAGFTKLASELAAAGAGEIQTHTRLGDPVAELIRAADDLSGDVLAMGADGYICHGRVVVGRTARRLLTESTIPILATPVLTSSEGTVLDLDAHRTATANVPLTASPAPE
jgi:nucleotide-binding universal stress UspA family protein